MDKISEILIDIYTDGTDYEKRIAQARQSFYTLLMEELPKKYDDYEQCTLGGHNEHNCEKNIIRKAKFEEHNKVLSEVEAMLKRVILEKGK